MGRGFFANKTKEDLGYLDKIDGRTGADTIRLWESYKEQAYLWKAIALLELPATFLALLAATVIYLTADIRVEPIEEPLPGRYSVKQLPDAKFLSVATEVVNLISNYTPAVAKQQFTKAKEFLWEPALSEFETRMLGASDQPGNTQLWAIISSGKSQVFLINQELVRVQRFPNKDIVVARIPGTLQKMIHKDALQSEEVVYYVKMTTIPRSTYNDSGIVIIDIRVKKQTSEELKQLDNQERMIG